MRTLRMPALACESGDTPHSGFADNPVAQIIWMVHECADRLGFSWREPG